MAEHRDFTGNKHELPKSLQGTEDADFVWNMITDRFPNAAPLLCEMESVIDRAEDLLQQLRTPCREIETSTSFSTQDSEESALMISARGSLTTENDITEENYSILKNVVETQVSKVSVVEDVHVPNRNQNSVSKGQCTYDQSSESTVTDYISSEDKSNVKLTSSNAKTITNQVSKEAHSLEEWGKIADSAMQGCIAGNRITKHAKYEKDRPESCIVLHRQELGDDVGDSTVDMVSVDNSDKMIDAKVDADHGDENSLKTNDKRTAVNILDEYAKRCNVSINYECTTDTQHRRKSNVYVIRANLAGFVATCRGFSEYTTKNDVAAKILQMVANQQMNGEKLALLVELTREEITEIINYGMDGLRETPQRKLYQLCLEKGALVPKYTVESMQSCRGLAYVATCTALGYTCEGHGVRDRVAKKLAANQVYHQYCQDHKIKLKVNSPDALYM